MFLSISGLISFRIVWLEFLAVQRTLESLTQHPQIETVDSSGSQSPSAVILEHKKKKKSATVSTFPPSICHEVMGPDATILVFFESWVLSQFCHYPLSSSSGGSLVPLCFLPSGCYHLHIWGCWSFSGQSWLHLVRHPALHDVPAYKLHKQGDNILQPWLTPFPILNFIVPRFNK